MSARFPRIVLAVPFVPQQRHGECLVACALMSLSYLGRQPDYARIVRQLDLTAIGTPFPNIRRLAGNDDFDLAWLERDEEYAVLHL
jgi:ABC-type bacteriocin/lantibiotic exporter with double-glycine peptidase domain